MLSSKKSDTTKFSLLTSHPELGILKTALGKKQTYDQIGFLSRDSKLPTPDNNDSAGSTPGGYDYGLFNLANLISEALNNKDIHAVTTAQKKTIFKNRYLILANIYPRGFGYQCQNKPSEKLTEAISGFQQPNDSTLLLKPRAVQREADKYLENWWQFKALNTYISERF